MKKIFMALTLCLMSVIAFGQKIIMLNDKIIYNTDSIVYMDESKLWVPKMEIKRYDYHVVVKSNRSDFVYLDKVYKSREQVNSALRVYNYPNYSIFIDSTFLRIDTVDFGIYSSQIDEPWNYNKIYVPKVCYNVYRDKKLIGSYDIEYDSIIRKNLMNPEQVSKIFNTSPYCLWKDVVIDYTWGDNDEWGIKQYLNVKIKAPGGQKKTLKKIEFIFKFYNNINEYLGQKTFIVTGYLEAFEDETSRFEFYAPNNSYEMKLSAVKTYFTDNSVSSSYNTLDNLAEAYSKWIDKNVLIIKTK